MAASAEDANDSSQARCLFFELPRELRDEIYEHLKDKLPAASSWVSPRTGYYKPPRTSATVMTLGLNVLLINRQFKEEAEVQTSGAVHMDLGEIPSGRRWCDGKFKYDHWIFSSVTHVSIPLSAVCDMSFRCHAAEEIKSHRTWINRTFEQFHNLRTLVVRMEIGLEHPWHDTAQAIQAARHRQSLENALGYFVQMTMPLRLEVSEIVCKSDNTQIRSSRTWEGDKGWTDGDTVVTTLQASNAGPI
jgi:hypothetical protein